MHIKAVLRTGVVALCATAIGTGAALAQTVRVGLINTYSGPMASNGDQIEKAINLFMKLGECKLPAGVNLEIIKRDDTGINPETAKRLAQELIVRDKVQLLTGVVWTPDAMAMAPLATEAKVPFIIMNAGTAMTRPARVATSTSPMAPASCDGSPIPDSPSRLNARIIPVTVPVRPIIGVVTPITER